jgi:hypothetical protein
MVSRAVRESRLVVGSSHSSSRGLASRATAIERRRRSPDEIRSRKLVSPTRRRAAPLSPREVSSASRGARPPWWPRSEAWKDSVSSTVSIGASGKSCGTIAIVGGAPFAAAPLDAAPLDTTTLPPLGLRSPARTSNSVVLPAPDSPRMATSSPGPHPPETSLSTLCFPSVRSIPQNARCAPPEACATSGTSIRGTKCAQRSSSFTEVS